MRKKLSAILQIIFSDQFAVFSFNEEAPNPNWLTVPTFKWNISHNDRTFYCFIRKRLEILEDERRNTGDYSLRKKPLIPMQ